MAEMTCNEFLKAMQAEFGPCEYKATKGDQVIQSKGWPKGNHPANLSDEMFVIPQLPPRKKEQ